MDKVFRYVYGKNKIEPDIVRIDVERTEYLVSLGGKNVLNKRLFKIYRELYLHKGRDSPGNFGHPKKHLFST